MSAQPQTSPRAPNLGMQVTTFENPMGINGFEFVEFAAPEGQGARMRDYLEKLGFTAIARHRKRAITLFRQGTINFLLNEEPDSFASDFAAQHGPSACGFAIRFKKKPAEVLEHVARDRAERLDAQPPAAELLGQAQVEQGSGVLEILEAHQADAAQLGMVEPEARRLVVLEGSLVYRRGDLLGRAS